MNFRLRKKRIKSHIIFYLAPENAVQILQSICFNTIDNDIFVVHLPKRVLIYVWICQAVSLITSELKRE